MLNANRTKYYDVKLYLENINLELIANINKIEPYGVGNPKPRFLIPDVRIANFKYIGNDKSHISCILTSKGNFKSQSLNAIAFNCINSNIEKFIISNNYKKIDIIATININHWQGNKNIQIIIEDIIITK
jgi:single-stranded-DNA-specific exonuclease